MHKYLVPACGLTIAIAMAGLAAQQLSPSAGPVDHEMLLSRLPRGAVGHSNIDRIGGNGAPSSRATTGSTAMQTTSAEGVSCGTDYLASGWPTTTVAGPAYAACIFHAFATGRHATYREVAQTDGHGGHDEVTTYQVVGIHEILVTVDAAKALHPGPIRERKCTVLVAGIHGLSARRCMASSVAACGEWAHKLRRDAC